MPLWFILFIMTLIIKCIDNSKYGLVYTDVMIDAENHYEYMKTNNVKKSENK